MFQKNAGSAVGFDSPILLDCDIVDLPGFGTEKRLMILLLFEQHSVQIFLFIYLKQMVS